MEEVDALLLNSEPQRWCYPFVQLWLDVNDEHPTFVGAIVTHWSLPDWCQQHHIAKWWEPYAPTKASPIQNTSLHLHPKQHLNNNDDFSSLFQEDGK
jgi:hypothetical protein